MSQTNNFPQYVAFAKNGDCALEHWSKGEYHRVAGEWRLQAEFVKGKLVVKSCIGQHLIGEELFEISKALWKISNHGYV